MNHSSQGHFKAVLPARHDALQQRLARPDENAKATAHASSEMIDQAAAGYSKEMLTESMTVAGCAFGLLL